MTSWKGFFLTYVVVLVAVLILIWLAQMLHPAMGIIIPNSAEDASDEEE